MAVAIKDVYPTRAQFLSMQPIELAVELINTGKESKHLEIVVNIYHLAVEVECIRLSTDLAGESGKTVQVVVSPKNSDFCGYGADVYVYDLGHCVDVYSSAFDVVSNWRKSTRYGFLSDFGVAELGDEEDVKLMNKLHINLVQFYDWMYKHDQLVSEEDEYTDLMGKASSLSVIREKIDLCHKYGMKSIAYGAIYAASREFYEKHPEWALYDSNGNVLDFINIFYMMNISEESPWHQHIIGEYKAAIDKLGFDGIHMDTYGSPKIAMSGLAGDRRMMRLDAQFPVLINNTRKALENDQKDICLMLNNVGNWPVDTVAQAKQDVMYIEVWKPYERYHHLKQIIQEASIHSAGKPVILAAYLKPFMEQTGEALRGAEISALLLTAVIVSHGGYHLLLGEQHGVLTQGYYVDYSTIDEEFFQEIRNYYDFMIRYLNIFYDNSLRDVSMTHADGDNIEYRCELFPYSTYGEADKVWTVIKEKPGVKTISLINLHGVSNDLWNEAKETPKRVNDLKLRILVESEVESIYVASPDLDMGRSMVPEYSTEKGPKGLTLVVTLPQLQIWTLLVVNLKQ